MYIIYFKKIILKILFENFILIWKVYFKMYFKKLWDADSM